MLSEIRKIVERLDRIERRLETLHADVRRNGEEITRSNLRRPRSEPEKSASRDNGQN
jgi:hypothetical protein